MLSTKLTSAVFLAALVLATGAEAQSAKVTSLITQWKVNINLCRGAPEAKWFAPETTRACEREARASLKLNRLGWCYGRKSDASEAVHNWHRCKADSYRAKPVNQ